MHGCKQKQNLTSRFLSVSVPSEDTGFFGNWAKNFQVWSGNFWAGFLLYLHHLDSLAQDHTIERGKNLHCKSYNPYKRFAVHNSTLQVVS